jgi:inorganic triphosphatase YgiF
MSGGWFQAVKSTGSSIAGLHQRMEWEDIISGPEPDFSKITEPGLAAIFADFGLRQALKPIFTTDVSRTEWQLAYESSKIELALDMGKLLIHAQTDKKTAVESGISEIELELKQGKPSDVFALAIALQHDIALTIENTSKAEYGYVHFRSTPFKPLTSIATDTTIASPWDCLQTLQDALKSSNSDTPTHIRTAINHLNQLIVSSENEQKSLLAELGWLEELCEQTSQDEQLRTVINSQRYQGLLLKLAAWLLK